MKSNLFTLLVAGALWLSPAQGEAISGNIRHTQAQLPFGFEQSVYVDALRDPNAMEFAPDGRLFIGERITGRLRVVENGRLLSEPFVTLPVPPEIPGRREEAAQPGFRYRHIYHYGNYRSSGLEGIAFDPDFERNGHVYLYYMNDQPRLNRVVRVTASAENPNISSPNSLKVLLDIPMHTHPTDGPVRDGGSHNGGALLFGPDGKLYVTVGDGWNPAPREGPQDLGLLIGKVLRINRDGTVPEDNPFVGVPGARPEIWALGFRNPYTASLHPESRRIYVNDVVGGKEAVFQLVKGGNYRHPFTGDAGTPQRPWHMGNGMIAGGAWYFADQFPKEYRGSYFITDWRGHIVRRLLSEDEPQAIDFATGALHPVQTKVGPDGSLYWLSTTYETLNGTVYRVRFRPGTPVAAVPAISPSGGTFDQPVTVTMESSTPGAEIRYTLNGTDPSSASPMYREPFVLSSTATVRARAFASKMHRSAAATARFESTAPFVLSGPELAGRWPLDDGVGALARDISGQGRHGRLQNVSWDELEGLETTLQFNGRDSRVELGTWDIEYPVFSITAWIRPTSFPNSAENRILSKATGDSEQAHYWMFSTVRRDGIRLRFRLKTHGHTTTLIASSGEIPTGEWSHVAATYDGETMRLFLNGSDVGTLPKNGPPDRHPDVPVWLGANPRSSPPRTFAGAIGEVQIHHRALAEAELRELMDQTAPGVDEAALKVRNEKLAAYAPALTLAGSKEGGREIFMERCMNCHRMDETLGRALGPDLESMAVREPAGLLEAILDPSRNMAPEYWFYRIETEAGETLEGVVTEETRDNLTLRPLFGDMETVPRSAIRRFERIEHSAMPEGLESGLTPEQMAGLLAFLRSAATGQESSR